MVTSLGEISSRLHRESLAERSFKVAKLEVERRSPAGRAQVVRLVDGAGNALRLSGEKMRSVFGYMNLRSTLFEIKAASATRIEFSGRGFGHGTGLCQWGSRAMAVNGKTYQEILSHYYPKLSLAQIQR
jgi:stage II sporulation protein D